MLADTGKSSQRDRLLPAPAVVYRLMALALWRQTPFEEVLGAVCQGMEWLGGCKSDAVQVRTSAIVST